MHPVVILNLKAYEEGSNRRALHLVEIASKLVREGHDIRIAAQAVDIRLLAGRGVPIYAQHADPIGPGKHTGFISPHALKLAGARGTLLNHSEHRLRIDVLEDTIKYAHAERLHVCVCAVDAQMAAAVSAFKPEFIAVEPPELIGGKVSVSSAKPELITDSVRAVGGKNLLVGAGVQSSKDLKVALELGARGVLLSSHVVLAHDPEKVLRGLLHID